MRRILLSIIFLSICGFLQAADDYEKMAQAVREEVWNWDLPAFNNRVIPAEYDTCSAVILARHEQIFVGTKKKIRYDPMTILARNAELTYTNTDRMMIKINDKRALDNYSEIEFQQMKKSYGYRIQNTFTSIIGARIIKPDGNIIEIDASQSIALLDEKSDKQRKLTIPNLQVGDILDYFYYDEYKMDNQDIHSLIFHLASSTPMLSYSIHCEAEKGIRLEYRPYNNAPDFTSSNAPETNNLILDLQTADIQTYRSNIWTNAIRNFPLIRMNIIHIDNKNIARPKRENNQSMLIKNPSYQQVIEDTKWSASLESRGFYYDRKGSLFFEKKIKNLKDKYVSNHPNASLDEISAFIFYAQRFYAFNTITEESKILVDADRNFRKADNRIYHIQLERYIHRLNKADNYELGFIANKDEPRFDEIFSRFDLDFAVIKSSDLHKILACTSPFTHAWYIPIDYEGEKAASFLVNKYGSYPSGQLKAQDKGIVEIPISQAENNKNTETITVNIDPSFSMLTIDRKACLTGHFRENQQRLLLLFEDYDAEQRKYLGIDMNFWEEMSADQKLRKLIPDYKAAIKKAREKQKEYFTTEAESFHKDKIKEIIDYEIINSGIFHDNPEFIYRNKYTIDGLLKKAGNDYILDAGMLIGDQVHLTEQQRNRQLDVYMPFARDFEYDITVQIPDGYTVGNAEKLNREIKNSCGQFKSTATIERNTLSIKVSKIFEQAYIPIGKWSELLEILDVATDFIHQNVVFTKTGVLL